MGTGALMSNDMFAMVRVPRSLEYCWPLMSREVCAWWSAWRGISFWALHVSNVFGEEESDVFSSRMCYKNA